MSNSGQERFDTPTTDLGRPLGNSSLTSAHEQYRPPVQDEYLTELMEPIRDEAHYMPPATPQWGVVYREGIPFGGFKDPVSGVFDVETMWELDPYTMERVRPVKPKRAEVVRNDDDYDYHVSKRGGKVHFRGDGHQESVEDEILHHARKILQKRYPNLPPPNGSSARYNNDWQPQPEPGQTPRPAIGQAEQPYTPPAPQTQRGIGGLGFEEARTPIEKERRERPRLSQNAQKRLFGAALAGFIFFGGINIGDMAMHTVVNGGKRVVHFQNPFSVDTIDKDPLAGWHDFQKVRAKFS